MTKPTIMKFSAQYVGICMVFAVYIAGSVEGAAYNATCTGANKGDCAETNNICVAGTLKCACATDAFRKDTTECATKIGLTKTCTAGQPTNQCADSNAECNTTASTCECKSAHYVNKDGACDPQIALNKTCTAGQPAGQCADSNAACDGTAFKCQCKSTHFVSKTGACKLGKKPDEEGCAADECVTHATCNTKANPTKCQCDTGYTATPTTTPTMCSGVPKVTTLSHMCVVPILLLMMFPLQ